MDRHNYKLLILMCLAQTVINNQTDERAFDALQIEYVDSMKDSLEQHLKGDSINERRSQNVLRETFRTPSKVRDTTKARLMFMMQEIYRDSDRTYKRTLVIKKIHSYSKEFVYGTSVCELIDKYKALIDIYRAAKALKNSKEKDRDKRLVNMIQSMETVSTEIAMTSDMMVMSSDVTVDTRNLDYGSSAKPKTKAKPPAKKKPWWSLGRTLEEENYKKQLKELKRQVKEARNATMERIK